MPLPGAPVCGPPTHQLAAPILFTSPSLRSCESVARNRFGQPRLWAHGISGDMPIALVRIGADRNLELVRKALQAHAYWRRCGHVVDLVLLKDNGTDDELRRQLEEQVQNAHTAELIDRPGGIFLRDASRMSADDVTPLEAAARLLLRGVDGPLAAQLGRVPADAPPLPPLLLPILLTGLLRPPKSGDLSSIRTRLTGPDRHSDRPPFGLAGSMQEQAGRVQGQTFAVVDRPSRLVDHSIPLWHPTGPIVPTT